MLPQPVAKAKRFAGQNDSSPKQPLSGMTTGAIWQRRRARMLDDVAMAAGTDARQPSGTPVLQFQIGEGEGSR